ncbi:MAG: lysoplasmalogenase [Gemmatimonadetes bacterium]|nr:lysoplasmalogenase [Gemmatimonadota bacterium]
MPITWLVAGVAVALLDWLATALSWHRVRCLSKPLVLVCLIAWVLTTGDRAQNLTLLALGLAFALVGDIFLLRPLLARVPSLFWAGLASFLVMQLLYTATLLDVPPPLNGKTALAVLLALLGLAVDVRLLLHSARTLRGWLRIPVLAYLGTLALMLGSALLLPARPEWSALQAALVAGGAALFFFSDSLLGYDRFVARVRHSELVTIITYHLGQFGIAGGVLLHAIV